MTNPQTTKALSPTRVEALEASLKHFGPSQDGAVERDLAAAKERESKTTKAKTRIHKFGRLYQLRLCIGNQCFNIDEPRPKAEAVWFQKMLRKALKRTGAA